MKFVALLAALGLSSLGSAFGLGIDVESLGTKLNGWSKKRTATYTVDNHTYRTHVPTVTRNLDGGIFVSMRVEHISALRADAVAYLELTFTPAGYVGASQIRLTMNGNRYDTGQVLRTEEQALPEGEIGSVDWRSTHMKMVLELFRKLDGEFAKAEKEEEAGTRDLWGRFRGSELEEADVAAALRHNLNLLLANVGYGFSSEYSGK
ncbi:hypothetical protein [Roseibacillus ishigakijimensis]|uniref:DUF4468 domain-containing protein n=1 Tax=Roseibacillus ishigakijimensis TaxID=454146 RepID=A0A934RNC2_9BACT|nr:hypothetical protein [Roseibacillus ishigakijimensis]MBK1833978.1 hypothetical protein [Roseibacillus ishigakijimensis]